MKTKLFHCNHFLTQQFTEARSPWLLRGQLLLFSLSAGWEIMITANVWAPAAELLEARSSPLSTFWLLRIFSSVLHTSPQALRITVDVLDFCSKTPYGLKLIANWGWKPVGNLNNKSKTLIIPHGKDK